LDNTVRTMGGVVRDVVVRCLSTQCRVVLLYQPSYFFIEGADARTEAQMSVGEAFMAALQPILRASPELRFTGGGPQVQVSREAPVGTELDSPAGTALDGSGIIAGVFMLSRDPADQDRAARSIQ
jgi:hypothetical protein